MPEPKQTWKPIQILRYAFSVVIKHIWSYHLIGSLCLRSESKYWWLLWECLPCRKIVCALVCRKLLWVWAHVWGYLIAPSILVKLIKWLLPLFIKDSHLLDSPTSSSFMSGHCCRLVLMKTVSLQCYCLEDALLGQTKDRMVFASSMCLFGQHVLSRCGTDRVWSSPGFYNPLHCHLVWCHWNLRSWRPSLSVKTKYCWQRQML